MRKIVATLSFAFTLLLLPSFSSAQFNKYHPFPDSTGAWRETNWWCVSCLGQGNGTGLREYDYYVRGDTVVKGKTYSKLNYSGGYEHASDYADTVWQCYNSLFCLLRNDTVNKKLYASFSPNYGRDTLVYDFNLNIGDTLPDTYITRKSLGYYVYSIDSILVGATYRKQFIIASNNGINTLIFDSIIEGIGSTEGFFYIHPSFEGGNYLDCYTDSAVSFPIMYGPCNIFYTCSPTAVANVTYPQKPISTYPNPSSGVFTLQWLGVSGQGLVVVYNILGEKVYSTNYSLSTNHYSLDLSSQPNGVYLYRVMDDSGGLIGEGKLVIER